MLTVTDDVIARAMLTAFSTTSEISLKRQWGTGHIDFATYNWPKLGKISTAEHLSNLLSITRENDKSHRLAN
jgi:hypothetical protein